MEKKESQTKERTRERNGDRGKHVPDLQWVYLPRDMNEDMSAVMRAKINVSADGLWNPFVLGSLEKQDSVVYLIG